MKIFCDLYKQTQALLLPSVFFVSLVYNKLYSQSLSSVFMVGIETHFLAIFTVCKFSISNLELFCESSVVFIMKSSAFP